MKNHEKLFFGIIFGVFLAFVTVIGLVANYDADLTGHTAKDYVGEPVHVVAETSTSIATVSTMTIALGILMVGVFVFAYSQYKKK